MIKKKYSNGLFNIALELGFQPVDFIVNPDRIENVFKIQFPNYNFRERSRLDFIIMNKSNSFDEFNIKSRKFLPGFPLEVNSKEYVNFERVISQFKDWLINHVRPYRQELEYPSYWDMYRFKSFELTSINTNDNSTFDGNEIPVIQSTLEDVKNQIKESFPLNSQQLSSLEEKIEYLKEGVNRLNKTDWKGILLSTILAIAYDLSLNEERRNTLVGIFSKVWLVLENLPPRLGAPL
jgi:hypothetical protein